MPRRRGRERYRTNKQARTATDYTAPRPPEPTIMLSVNGGLSKPVLRGGIALCRHEVPWTTCTECSRPVRP